MQKTSLIKKIKHHYIVNKKSIRKRLSEFKSVPSSEYFYELAYCLLTPQSKAAHAEEVIIKLRKAGFQYKEVNPEQVLSNKQHYIRFHKTKSRYLVRMKNQFPSIELKISEPSSAVELREWLVDNIVGMGYKEATHFLRNIGKNDNLAILDRHILRTLNKLSIIRLIPKSINKKQYLQIEQHLIKFSKKIGIKLDELDLTIWSMGTGEIRK